MDDQERDNFGEGSDDFIEGGRKAAEAAEKFGQSGNKASIGQQGAETGASQAPQQGAASGANQAVQSGIESGASAAQGAAAGAEAAVQSTEAAVNAAAATVKSGVEGGKAVAEITTGTAAGGPWGAVISAAWAMRHTLFKILVCICLLLMFLFAMVVSLPSIMFNYVFRTDPASAGVTMSYDLHDLFDEMAAAVAEGVNSGYNHAFEEIERIISEGGYNYELSMQALINHGSTSANYDVSYVLAAYSVAMEQKGTCKQDMIDRLAAVREQMFSVSYEIRETKITIPPESEDDEPAEEVVQFIAATIHHFDQSVILAAFDVDPTEKYSQFPITKGDAITNMANALRLTMFGAMRGGAVPPITDAEIAAFLENLDTTEVRKEIVATALSLVGRVPYFWGGKSPAGWNNDWNTPRLVTATGSSSTGTIRPFGLDCSGFTDWVYKTAHGVGLSGGTAHQWNVSTAITQRQLQPGDLGFLAVPGTVTFNHVLIYAGRDANGNMLWVHSTSGSGVVLDSPSYVSYFRRVNGIDWGA